MIRRVISILIALAGAALLYSWWQRGHEPPAPTLTAPATTQAGPEEGAAATGESEHEGEADDTAAALAQAASEEASEPPAAAQAAAGWTPTLVEFDRNDRNAPLIMLQRADAALAEDKIHEPAGESAIDLYYSVLTAAPGNTRARQGLDRALDLLAERAQLALARGDYPAIAKVLPVLEQMRSDDPEPARLRERLEAADAQRVALERAARALERDRLDEGNRSAVAYYRQVLEREPESVVAREGLTEVQRRLIAQAQASAHAGTYDEADALLVRAEAVDPQALQLLADARAVVAGQRSAAATELLSDAHRRLDEGDAEAAEALLERALAIEAEAGGAALVRERIRNLQLYGGYAEGERFQDRLGDGGEGPPMIVVPVGSFLMGSPEDEADRRANEGPQFRVRFDRGFALAETEITVAEFRRFVDATGHRTRAEQAGESTVYDERSGSMRERRGVDWRHDETGRDAAPGQPVIHVAWDDAAAYARWLAGATGQRYRLPSEAEFEYALRAGSTTPYPWGDGPPPRPLANVSSAGDRSRLRREWSNAFPGESDGWFGIAPVRSYPASAFGLHDLIGNASEWVEDCWHSTYSRAPSDGRAWVNPGCRSRVVRGASWASGPDQVRSAYRLSIGPETTSPRIGFRVARDL